MKRVKNHSQTFNSHTLRFVLENLKTLDICPELGVKAPTALGDFLATFNAIATCLLRSKGFQLKSELDKLINGFTAGSFDPLETGTEFKKLQAAHGFKTFAEFYAFSQTNKSARALLWFAAMAFVAKGDLSVTEDPQAQVDVTRQIITTPELLNWVPPQLETATGCTAETLRGMRNAIYDQLVDSQRVFNDLPSVERILTLCDAIPGFIDEQIDAYVASQTVRDLAGELQGQAA